MRSSQGDKPNKSSGGSSQVVIINTFGANLEKYP